MGTDGGGDGNQDAPIDEESFEKNWLLEINGVDCNLYTGPDGEDTLGESHPPEGRRVTVWLICRWQDRLRLIAGLLGTVAYEDGTVVRTPPFAYPVAEADDVTGPEAEGGVYPSRTFCTAIGGIRGVKWAADPDGSVTGLEGWGYYRYALIPAEFTTPPYLIEPLAGGGEGGGDMLGQAYCVSKTRIAGEMFSPPSGALKYKGGQFDGREVNDVNSSQIRVRYELSCTRVRMPLIPTATIDQFTGTVNANPFPLEDEQVAKGAALFMGANPQERSDPYDGQIVYDLELVWLVNADTSANGGPNPDWNYFLDPSGSWTQVIKAADGNPVFPYADHTELLSDEIQ
jgi:hypothetical protein